MKDYQLGRRPQGQEGNLFVLGEDKDIAGERVQYLVGLLEVAALYQLERLKSLIADALMPPSSMITHGNAFDIRRCAREASQADLIAFCAEFIRKNHSLMNDQVRVEISRVTQEIQRVKDDIQGVKEEIRRIENVADQGLDNSYEDLTKIDEESDGSEGFEVVDKKPDVSHPTIAEKLEELDELERELLNYEDQLQDFAGLETYTLEG